MLDKIGQFFSGKVQNTTTSPEQSSKTQKGTMSGHSVTPQGGEKTLISFVRSLFQSAPNKTQSTPPQISATKLSQNLNDKATTNSPEQARQDELLSEVKEMWNQEMNPQPIPMDIEPESQEIKNKVNLTFNGDRGSLTINGKQINTNNWDATNLKNLSNDIFNLPSDKQKILNDILKTNPNVLTLISNLGLEGYEFGSLSNQAATVKAPPEIKVSDTKTQEDIDVDMYNKKEFNTDMVKRVLENPTHRLHMTLRINYDLFVNNKPVSNENLLPVFEKLGKSLQLP